MDSDFIKQTLSEHFIDSLITIEGDSYHYKVTIISPSFEKKSKLQRHRAAYAPLAPFFANGSLHAITLHTKTPEEKLL